MIKQAYLLAKKKPVQSLIYGIYHLLKIKTPTEKLSGDPEMFLSYVKETYPWIYSIMKVPLKEYQENLSSLYGAEQDIDHELDYSLAKIQEKGLDDSHINDLIEQKSGDMTRQYEAYMPVIIDSLTQLQKLSYGLAYNIDPEVREISRGIENIVSNLKQKEKKHIKAQRTLCEMVKGL